MLRSVKVAVVASALALSLTGAARAQTVETPEDGVGVGGRLLVFYDSNLLRLDDGVEPTEGRSRDDLVSSVSAVARAQISPSLQRFYVDAEYGRDFHAENKFLNRDRVLLDAGWDWRIGTRCDGRIVAAFGQSQADLAEQGAIVANRRRNKSLAGGGGCRIGLGFRPSINLTRRESDNSSPVRRATDFEINTFQAELAYNRTGKTGVAIGYRSERFVFPNRIDVNTGRRTRVDRDAAGVRFNALIAARTTVSLFADYNRVEMDGRAQRFRGLSGGFITAYQPIPRLRVSALAVRELDAPLFVAAGFTVRDRAELAGSYSISPRTRLSLRGGVERNQYRGRQFTPGADIRSFDRLLYLNATADYRIARNTDLVLEARQNDRITDAAFGTFDGTRLSASLRIVL